MPFQTLGQLGGSFGYFNIFLLNSHFTEGDLMATLAVVCLDDQVVVAIKG